MERRGKNKKNLQGAPGEDPVVRGWIVYSVVVV